MINPQDTKEMLQEPDGKDLYQMASETKEALAHKQPMPQINVENEWSKFAAKHISKPWYVRYRAIAACAVLFVGVAVAAVIQFTANPKHAEKATGNNPSQQVQIGAKTQAEAFEFDNATLETVLTNLAFYYDAEVKFINKKSRKIRLHVQIDKQLSLQQAINLLNHFDKVKLSLENQNTIIVE